jgi:hypothetical protein
MTLWRQNSITGEICKNTGFQLQNLTFARKLLRKGGGGSRNTSAQEWP